MKGGIPLAAQPSRNDVYNMAQGIGPRERPSSSSVQFNAFKQSLQSFAQIIGAIDRDVQLQIQEALAQLLEDTVSLAFGGHFSSGKSTLINAAIGRTLLPTLDYPDTGAICVLQTGARDSAEIVYNRYRRQAIPCTTKAIAEQISLRLSTGMENTAVQQVEVVNITLANSPIPLKTHWIDSPGINDSDVMLERASVAARQSDVLLWVLNSRQFLSLVEQDFIKDYVAERGPTSVVFITNVFLENDTPQDWNHYLVNSFPTHMNKMKSAATTMGFTQKVPPEALAVSARALCTYKGDLFGGVNLQKLLQTLHQPAHPRIRRARLFQTVNVLQEATTRIRAKLQQEQERVRQAQILYEQAQQKADKQQKKFAEETAKAVARFLTEWRTNAYTSEKNVLMTINSSSLQRDNTYSRNLSDAFKRAAAMGIESLLKRVAEAVKLYEQKNLTSVDIATIRQMLTPPDAVVTIPNTSPSTGKGAATIVAGAAIGGIVPGIGHLIGALAGAAVAGVAAYNSHNTAVQQDVAAIQSNVSSATHQVISTLEGKQQQVQFFIIERCRSSKIFHHRAEYISVA